jgi:chromosomal replication initiator protein
MVASLRALEAALPEQAFRTWLAPTQAVAISQDLLVVSTPNPFAVDWVEDKYAELLAGLGESLFGAALHPVGAVPGERKGRRRSPRPPSRSRPSARAHRRDPHVSLRPAPRPRRRTRRAIRGSVPLNPRYVFDRFVVGGNNQLAAAAAHAVAEAPARTTTRSSSTAAWGWARRT